MTQASLATRVDALLPQTQCTRCGYDGCRPYAEAVAQRTAQINQCPPGGDVTIAALAALLEVPPMPLNPANGIETPATIAVIDEQRCIGCFKCVQACPVDAILGAAQQMHTVLAAECSGCELCLAPCPVDCIEMLPRPAALPLPADQTGLWRQRHEARLLRLEHERQIRNAARRRGATTLKDKAQSIDLAAAIARAKARRAADGAR